MAGYLFPRFIRELDNFTEMNADPCRWYPNLTYLVGPGEIFEGFVESQSKLDRIARGGECREEAIASVVPFLRAGKFS
ncbi:MAG: hypothetical protein U0798_18055 [Gemmataceae bacterium]